VMTLALICGPLALEIEDKEKNRTEGRV